MTVHFQGGYTIVYYILIPRLFFAVKKPVIYVYILSLKCFFIKVEIFDYNDDGDHDFIGQYFTTLEEMAEGEGFQIVTWDVINDKKKAKKKDYENSGTVILKSIKIEQVCTRRIIRLC